MERDNVVYYVVYSEKEREMRRGIDKEERAYIECRCDAGTRGEKGDGGGGERRRERTDVMLLDDRG